MSENNICIRNINIIGRTTRERIVHSKHCTALAHYGIGVAGVSNAASDFEFVRLAPGMVQVLACVGGCGEVLVGDEWQRCEAGQAYVTPAGIPHAYHALARTQWRVCWVMYTASAGPGHTPSLTAPTLVSGNFKALESAIEALYSEITAQAESGILFSLASLVHAYCQRTLLPRSRLAPLWDAVRDDLGRKWSVPDMADIAHVSPEHLRRLCEAETGSSPMRTLTQLRMREAAGLLFSESYKLHEIAERVGYDNVFAFSTAFKRTFGKAPSAYRASGG